MSFVYRLSCLSLMLCVFGSAFCEVSPPVGIDHVQELAEVAPQINRLSPSAPSPTQSKQKPDENRIAKEKEDKRVKEEAEEEEEQAVAIPKHIIHFQDYTVKIYGNGWSKGSFEIWKGAQRIYKQIRNDPEDPDAPEFSYGYAMTTDNPDHCDHCASGLAKYTFPGSYLTGERFPNLVIHEWTGGAYCCMHLHVFTLSDPIRYVGRLNAASGEEGVEFVDFDGDNIPEFRTVDMGCRLFGGTAKVPIIILKYNRQTGRYQLAGYLMRQPPPSEAALLNQAENIAMRIRALNPKGVRPESLDPRIEVELHRIEVELWEKINDLIFSGHGQKAWQFFDLAWPDQILGKAEIKAKFRDTLENSKYWRQLAAFSGLD